MSTDKSDIGIVNRNTAYLISTPDGIVACSTIRRLIDKEAYGPACLTEVTLRLADYIHKGARTKPIDTRITVPAAARTDPNPIATNFVPRGVKLTAKDSEK